MHHTTTFFTLMSIFFMQSVSSSLSTWPNSIGPTGHDGSLFMTLFWLSFSFLLTRKLGWEISLSFLPCFRFRALLAILLPSFSSDRTFFSLEILETVGNQNMYACKQYTNLCNVILIKYLPGMVHSIILLGTEIPSILHFRTTYVGSFSGQYGGTTTPNKDDSFSKTRSTFVWITRSAFLCCKKIYNKKSLWVF